MTPRPVPLTLPDSPRYPSIQTSGMLGLLHLRMPLYGTCSELLSLYAAGRPDPRYAAGHAADVAYGQALMEAEAAYAIAVAAADAAGLDVPARPADPVKPPDDHEREPQAVQMTRLERTSGAAIGLCWQHRSFALEASRENGEDLGAFGLRVCEELYDLGLSYIDVADIGQRCVTLVSHYLSAGLTAKTAGVGVGKP